MLKIAGKVRMARKVRIAGKVRIARKFKNVTMDVKRNRVNHVVDWNDNLNTENFTYPEC